MLPLSHLVLREIAVEEDVLPPPRMKVDLQGERISSTGHLLEYFLEFLGWRGEGIYSEVKDGLILRIHCSRRCVSVA